ncbi:MAG: SEC-C domain-containing protein [Acidobacteria bacterium]|nr:SEC-C domain-containing protein [Acidobacteriota bacterium]
MLSYVSVYRAIEKQMAEDAEYREKVAHRPLRSRARGFSDEELLARLHSLGVELDRPALERLCDKALSAEEIARPLNAKCVFKDTREEIECDWIWICVDALWQRWFPDNPSFEMLDDKIEEGCELKESGQIVAACRVWLEAWDDAMKIVDKGGFETIDDFDDEYNGTHELCVLADDLETGLWKAGREDGRFFVRRIEICEEALKRFKMGNDPALPNFRRALAAYYIELGESGKADDLFREWLDAEPQCGWALMLWSDCYRRNDTKFTDLRRAEELLRKGLSIAGVTELQDLFERLVDLYEEQGRDDEARVVRRQAKSMKVRLNPSKRNMHTDAPVSGSRRKVGRNDPCPCGSGLMYKKCCGAIGKPAK